VWLLEIAPGIGNFVKRGKTMRYLAFLGKKVAQSYGKTENNCWMKCWAEALQPLGADLLNHLDTPAHKM
jgi:hypothetical protein